MRPWFLASALLLIASAAARSQTVEITPVAGYRFGGGFSTAVGIEPADSLHRLRGEGRGELHLGLRLEARGFFTVLESDGAAFCEPGGECLVHAKGSDISQADVRAGLVLRF